MKIDLTIARYLIKTIIDAGFELRVHDGEEFATPRTANFAVLNEALASTDYDSLVVYKQDRIGSILLVWGNGTDVISDHTDNPVINELVRPAYEFADTLA